MKLIYEWINQSNEKRFDGKPVLLDLNLNFSEKYNAVYNASKGVLTIKRTNRSIPNAFYNCDCIESINCIAGENGCGKTTILRHLFKIETESPLLDHDKTIQIYEEDEKLFYYSNFKINKIDSIDLTIQLIDTKKLNSYSKIFVTNDMYGYINPRNPDNSTCLALTPYDIRSFTKDVMNCFCLNNGLKNKQQDNFEFYNSSLFSHPRSEVALNVMYLLLLSDSIKNKWTEFNYIIGFEMIASSKYVLDNCNESDSLDFYDVFDTLFKGREKDVLKNQINERLKSSFFNYYKHRYDDASDMLKIFAMHSLVRETNNRRESIITNLEDYLKTEILYSLYQYIGADEVVKYVPEKIDNLLKFYMKQIHGKIDKKQESARITYFDRANSSINSLKDIVKNENKVFFRFDTAGNHSNQLLDFLVEEIESKQSFILKYAFFSFKLSGGERSFLNIFAYVNSLKYLKHISTRSNEDIHDNILLLLDEPDLMCHPEWQRKMINNLIGMCKYCFANKKVQIIMTTHSPLLLSDFPQGRVITINKESRLSKTDYQTFGSNIYDLYKDSFFLKEYMGEFAENRINYAAKVISDAISKCQKDDIGSIDKNELEEAISVTELIGEPILKTGFERAINFIKEKM